MKMEGKAAMQGRRSRDDNYLRLILSTSSHGTHIDPQRTHEEEAYLGIEDNSWDRVEDNSPASWDRVIDFLPRIRWISDYSSMFCY